MADATGAIQMIAESSIMRSLWQRYQKNYSYANDVSWDMVIGALRGLAENAKASGECFKTRVYIISYRTLTDMKYAASRHAARAIHKNPE